MHGTLNESNFQEGSHHATTFFNRMNLLVIVCHLHILSNVNYYNI